MNTVPAPARPPRVSVALCSYNGAAYIGEQLASILAQTRPVDEIVVSDDGSSDDTMQRVQTALAGSAVAWRVLPGERLGITRNFARAVAACSGDIVCLSDQDDVWLPHKVQVLVNLLQRDAAAQLAFSNATLVGAALQPLGQTQFDMVRLTPALRAALAGPAAFRTLLRRNVVTGATVAFRRSLLDAALPFVDGWLHDEWLAIVAALHGPLLAAAEPLVLYRQHGRNQCGMAAEPLAQQLAQAAVRRRQPVGAMRLSALETRVIALRERAASLPLPLADVRQALAFQRRRDALPAPRPLRALRIAALALGGGYHRYDAGLRAIAKDLLAA